MKIEMLEDVLHGRDRFTAGEVRMVDEQTGALFCGRGWAKDLDGKVPTGERSTTPVGVAPDNASVEVG